MIKDKMTQARDFVVRNCKKVFPVVVVMVVAVTVAVALGAGRAKGQEPQDAMAGRNTEEPQISGMPESTVGAGAEPTMAPEKVPLIENTDEEIFNLVASYYNAMAQGDVETLKAIHDSLSVEETLRFAETSKFMDGYTAFQVFVKQGMEPGSLLACVYFKTMFVDYPVEFPGYQMLYICRDSQGKPYIKNEDNYTDEEVDYIEKVIGQDDVIEFSTRIDVEYKELLDVADNRAYLAELGREIDQAVGKALEDFVIAMARENVGEGGESVGEGGEEGRQPDGEPYVATQASVVSGPQYAVATATVNIRSSDSIQAERIGSVADGGRVQVEEVRPNGWSKIVYEGQKGFIKSEYLRMEEPEEPETVIGKVTATTNINIRSSAGMDGERLGLLAAGESLDLLAEEGEWCKVIYNGRTAYVKAEFVKKN